MRKGLRQYSAKRHANRYRRRPVVETQADILFFAVEIPQTLSDVGESAGTARGAGVRQIRGLAVASDPQVEAAVGVTGLNGQSGRRCRRALVLIVKEQFDHVVQRHRRKFRVERVRIDLQSY